MARGRQADRLITSRRPHAAVIAAMMLVGLLVLGEFVTIALETAPRPPLSRAALQPVLPNGSASAPALTWTNATTGATGGPIDLTGQQPLIVAACRDGGSIAIHLSDTTSIDLDCTDPVTAGPIVLDNRKSSSINVETTAGNPRYTVQILATTD